MSRIKRGDRVEYIKDPKRFGVMVVASDPERYNRQVVVTCEWQVKGGVGGEKYKQGLFEPDALRKVEDL